MHREKVRRRLRRRRVDDRRRQLIRNLAHLAGIIRRAVPQIALPQRIRAVEIRLHVHDGHERVCGRGAAGPARVAVAPVVDDESAGRRVAEVLRREDGEELAVCVEGDGAGGEVEAVFVEVV